MNFNDSSNNRRFVRFGRNWRAIPMPDDRLKRWMILDMASPGRGKEQVADKIRREEDAKRMAAANEMLDALVSAHPFITDEAARMQVGIAIVKAMEGK